MIRLATPADLPAIRTTAEEGYSRYIEAIGKKPAPMLADFAAQIARGDIRVCEVDGQVAGYISYFDEGDHIHLEAVALRPAFAGRGLGGAMIAHCEAEARARGFAAVELYTNELMTPNLTLYPHLGYRETGRREEHGYRRVFYRKDWTA